LHLHKHKLAMRKKTYIQQHSNSDDYIAVKNNNTLCKTTISEMLINIGKQKDFAMLMLKKSYMISSIKKFICDIELFIKWTKSENLCVTDVTYNNMMAYILHIKPCIRQKTIACKINSIRHFFNFLNETGKMNYNPASGIKIKGIKDKVLYDLLSVSELEDIYFTYNTQRNKMNINKSWFKPDLLVTKRNKVILGLMIFQGLGTREIADIVVSDIILNEGKIIIRGNTKSNSRVLRLESFQIMEFKEYLSTVRKKILLKSNKSNNKIFTSMGSGNSICNLAKKLIISLKKKNRKIYSFRQIRSSVISGWLKIYNLRHVQYMIGHKYVSSTETYLYNQTDTLYTDVNRFHPII
jgi:site-specific recombinase XerD